MALKISKIQSNHDNLLENEKKQYSDKSAEILESIYIDNFFKISHYVEKGQGIITMRDSLSRHSIGRGAVIVGAGPSLDLNIDVLREFKDDVFIIACDAALPVLHKHDIHPNVVAVIDHSDRQVKNFSNLDVSDSFVYMASIVNPLTFDEARRSKSRILWYNLFDDNSNICSAIPTMTGKKGALLPGVLTSSIAMQIAFWLGFKDIAFIGNDISYVDINKGYASDIDDEKKKFQYKNKIENDSNLRIVKDIYNNDVHTHPVFLAFVSWLNDNLEKIWSGARVFNCSEQGILQGKMIKQEKLSEFINIYGKAGYGRECQEILNHIYYSEKQLFEYVIAPIPGGDD